MQIEFLQLVYFGVILSLVILIIVYLIIIKNNENITQNTKDALSKINYRLNEIENNNNDFSNVPRNKIIKEEISYIKFQISELKNRIENSDFIGKNIPNCQPQEAGEKKQSFDSDLREVIYLSTPNSDGSFNVSSASTLFKEGASIYRITKISNRIGKFQIEEKEGAIKLALQYPDKNIDPVCETLNSFYPNAKHIKTDIEGEVELINDKWMKTKKAKIYYES